MDRLKLTTPTQSIPEAPKKKRQRGHQLGQKLSQETKQKIRDRYRERLWTKDSGVPRPAAANGKGSDGKE